MNLALCLKLSWAGVFQRHRLGTISMEKRSESLKDRAHDTAAKPAVCRGCSGLWGTGTAQVSPLGACIPVSATQRLTLPLINCSPGRRVSEVLAVTSVDTHTYIFAQCQDILV